MQLITNYAVAILSYNHPDLTAKTVSSVLYAGFNESKIYLVHNGSELKHRTALINQFPLIRHLIINENRGYSGGANFAFEEIFKLETNLLFLTNDTEVLSLTADFPTDLDFFSVLIRKRNSANLDSIMGAVNLRTGQLSHLKAVADLKFSNKDLQTYVPGTAFGITKKTYVTIGGFDESFHTYWEDVDFSLRAHATAPAIRLGFFEGFQVKHKIGKTCHKHRFYTLYLFQRNRKRLLKKFGTSRFFFYSHFTMDMIRLLVKILKSDNLTTDLKFWWKAVCD